MTTTLPATSRASIASTATIEGDDDDDDSWLLRKNKKSVKSAWRLSYQSFLKSFQEEDKEKNAVTSVTWIPLANRLAEFVIKERYVFIALLYTYFYLLYKGKQFFPFLDIPSMSSALFCGWLY